MRRRERHPGSRRRSAALRKRDIPRSRRTASWLAAALLVAGAAVTVAVLRAGREAAHEAPPHPAASASLEEANARAVALVLEGRAVESLPWFRRQFALMNERVWAAHLDFASALHNAAAESGPEGPHTRSSLERVALLREALHELDVAESLAIAPADRLRVRIDRAHTLEFWGMPYDALVALDSAAATPGAPLEVAARTRAAREALRLPGVPARAAGTRARG